MKKYLVYFITALLISCPFFALLLTSPASADSSDLLWNNSAENFQAATGLGNRDPRDIAAQAINVMLGFIGVVAVVIILLGGFRLMTAAGNEDRVSEAKKIMGSGIAGLIIILSAYALAYFVLNALYQATGANG